MQLRTREVEEVIARRFAIAAEGRTALRGRLEHLRRLGTPKGVQRGQGKAAYFGWDELLPLMVAVELLNVGLTPDHAHRIVSNSANEIEQGFAHLALDLNKDLVPAAATGRLPIGGEAPLMVTGDAFSALRHQNADKPPLAFRLSSHFDFQGQALEATTSRVTLDLALTAIHLLRALSACFDMPKAVLANSFTDWAGEHVQNP